MLLAQQHVTFPGLARLAVVLALPLAAGRCSLTCALPRAAGASPPALFVSKGVLEPLLSALCEKMRVEYGFKLSLPCLAETPVEAFGMAGWIFLETESSSSGRPFRKLQTYRSAVIMQRLRNLSYSLVLSQICTISFTSDSRRECKSLFLASKETSVKISSVYKHI